MNAENAQERVSDSASHSCSSSLTVESSIPPAPDGGWGWVIVFAGFIIHFLADGITLSFGVFFVEFLDYFNTSHSNTAWVSSLFSGVPLLAGPIASILIDRFSCRSVTVAGGMLASFAFIVSYWASSIQALIFTIGVLAGLGLAFVFVAPIVCVSFYFEKRRALATGITTSGSGVGMFAFSPLLKLLIDRFTWQGSVLIVGALFLNLMVCGVLLRPLQWPNQEKHTQRKNLELLEKLSMQASRDQRNDVTGTRSQKELGLGAQSCRSHSAVDLVKSSTVYLEPEETLSENLLVDGECQTTDTNMANIACQTDDTIDELITKQHHLRISRQNITSRGCMLNSSRYRIRASSCPDIYESFLVKKRAVRTEKNIFMSILKEVKYAFTETISQKTIKDPIYIIFWLSNFLTYMFYDTMFIFLTDFALMKGVDDDKSVILLSIIGILNTIGILFFGWVGDLRKVSTVIVYAVSTIIAGLVMSMVPILNSYTALVIMSATYGFCVSTNYALSSVILVDLIGLEMFTSAYGLLLLGQGIGTLVGPPFVGWLYDMTGNYTASFVVSGVFLAVSGIMLVPMHYWQQRRYKNMCKMDSSSGAHSCFADK